jgi:2-polyprenyl-3-methyl-5-hydroxy-6-metoxy-1,4-benzoquinol methylase
VARPAYEPTHCVVCGHADAVTITTAEDIRREIELLWDFHVARLRPDTPPARLMDRVTFSEPPPLALVRCRDCGLVYRNPVERSHALEEIYADADGDEALYESLHRTQLPAYRSQARRLADALGGSGTVLEVGSYVGGFLAAAREQGLQAMGIDIGAAVNRFTRGLGFTVHDGELAELDADHRFDAVAIWNTFDQLDDPRGTLRAAAARLGDGGMLALRLPNGAYYARLAPMARSGVGRRSEVARALLAHNNLLTFPYRTGFTPRSLARLLNTAGFEVRHMFGDTLVPIADRYTLPRARAEELALKRWQRGRLRRRRSLAAAPWFEVYAVRRSAPGEWNSARSVDVPDVTREIR